MAKRRSEEARVLAYFQTAELEKAELMLGLAKEAVKGRKPAIRSTTRKPKVASAVAEG